MRRKERKHSRSPLHTIPQGAVWTAETSHYHENENGSMGRVAIKNLRLAKYKKNGKFNLNSGQQNKILVDHFCIFENSVPSNVQIPNNVQIWFKLEPNKYDYYGDIRTGAIITDLLFYVSGRFNHITKRRETERRNVSWNSKAEVN